MLVIGSRALRRTTSAARTALDWDLVATREELSALTASLPPVYEHAWTREKAYFVFEERPLEVIVADGTVWMDVLALPAHRASHEGLGLIAYASADTQLLLKTSHAHLTHHWRKTARDVDALIEDGAAIAPEHEPLLERLRVHAERRRGADRCAFGPPMRLFPDPANAFVGQQRRALVARHPSVARVVDRSRPTMARLVPTSRDEAAQLLAELTMIHAMEHALAYDGIGERSAIDDALETLCTDVLGRTLRIALAPHAEEAARRIPKGFSRRLMPIVRSSFERLHWRRTVPCDSFGFAKL